MDCDLRVVESLRPLERWKADPTPVREVPPAYLRFLLLAGAERRITKHGIRFGGLHFIAPELNGRVGQTVEVRWMPHDLRTIEVFYTGQWLCTARPQGALTAEERDQVLTRRRRDAAELARRQRRTSRQARFTTCPHHWDRSDRGGHRRHPRPGQTGRLPP